jgi:CubicO group peptidase (beta-lactamase class C family)
MNKKCFQSMMAVPCLVLAALLGRPAEIVRASADPAAGWQEFFDQAVPEQLAALHIAGAAVAVVAGGELVFSKGYGYADVENRIEVNPDATLFRIGSITKLFTWTAVMQLAEQGKLDLDADVNGYLDFRIPDTYPQAITLRHLMAHTAGFEDRVSGYQAVGPQDIPPLGKWLAAHLPARVRAPGELASYSNYGAALAGYIVERAAGISYEDYLDKNIFGPLRMERTTVRQPPPEDWTANMSKGYVSAGGQFAETDFEYIVPAPTGAISSTATDMARFMSAQLSGGSYRGARILRETTTEQMHIRLFGPEPRLNGWAYGFYEMNRNGLRVIGHEGDTRLFHGGLALIPEKNLGIFIVYNSDTAFNAQYQLRKKLLDAFFPSTAPAPEKLALTAEELAKFAGSYRQTSRFAETTVEKAAALLEPIIIQPTGDGALLLSSADYGVYRFEPIEPLVFVQEDDPQSILIFRTDAGGRVTQAFVGDDPTTALEKLPWYADYTLHYLILIGGVLLFLCALLFALVRWIVLRSKKRDAGSDRGAVAGRRIFGWLSLAGILFPIGFILGFGGITFGQTGLLDVVLVIPLLFGALLTAAIVFLVLAWSRKWLPLAERIFYSLVAFAGIAFLGSLNYWNLIGWKY